MARFNKIYLGPVDKPLPQARELPASVALTPGTLVVVAAGKFAPAGDDNEGKFWIVQDNYLQLKGVDANWAANDTAIGLELLDDRIYAGRIGTGANVTYGTPLKHAANGRLAVATLGTDRVIAYADEVFNNTTGAEQLIKIRVAGTPGLTGPAGP